MCFSYWMRLNDFCAFLQAGCTALHEAALNGHHSVVLFLLERGAAVNVITKVSTWSNKFALSFTIQYIACLDILP